MEKIAKEFRDRKVIMYFEEYEEIRNSWNEIEYKIAKGEITNDEGKKLIEKFRKRLQSIEISFLKTDEFLDFTISLFTNMTPSLVWIPLGLRGAAHEIEHAIPYLLIKQNGLDVRLGWHKFKSKLEGQYDYKPFMEAIGEVYESWPKEIKANIRYQSLKNAKDPSKCDLKDIDLLEKLYPHLKK